MRTFRTRRGLTALAAFALAAASPAMITAAASPAAAKATTAEPSVTSACTSTTKGVTEVVDFTKLGGKVQVACDPTNPKTGLTALTGAGFTYAFVPKEPGEVCTIDHEPNPCQISAKGYWSYWHATRGGKWVFASTGAGSYHPKPGSVEGWAFGSGEKPRIAPPGSS
jgi:hypothetical protein